MRTISLVELSRASTICLPSGEMANPVTSFAEKCVHWRGGAGLLPGGPSGCLNLADSAFVCLRMRSQDQPNCLRGQAHTAHHLNIAPVGTNAVEPRIAFQPDHPVRMILQRLLQPFERLLFVSKTHVNDRHVKCRDVPLLCQLLQV